MRKIKTPATDEKARDIINQIHRHGWATDYASAENIVRYALRQIQPSSTLLANINYTYTIAFDYLNESYLSFRLQNGSFSLLRVAILTECDYTTFSSIGVTLPATDLKALAEQLYNANIDVYAADNKNEIIEWVFSKI